MDPKVSVIIRLYNGIEYLGEAIDSVINQTYDNWDLTVGVNGHGPDKNDVHLEALYLCGSKCSKTNNRLRVINYPDIHGGAQALNALAADSVGSWIAILDVDDKWSPHKLEAQLHMLDTLDPEPDVVGTFCQYFGDMGGMPNIPGEFIQKEQFATMNPIINSSVLMRRELVAFTDRFGLDDYDLWSRLVLKGKVFYNIPHVLTQHRISNRSFYNASGNQDVAGLQRHYFGGN